MIPRYAIEATTTLAERPTGISRYARCLIEALAALDASAAGEFELVLLYRSSRFSRRRQLPAGRRICPQMWRGPLWPPIRNYDVVHATDHRLPPWRGPAMVATIYDLYAALGINFADPSERARQVRLLSELAARCDRLIFISENTRKDFLKTFEYPEGRAHAIHLGVGEEFRPQTRARITDVRERHGIAGPYLFFVGLHYPNKNLVRLLEAFARSRLRDELTLVLAGPVPDALEGRSMQERIESLGLGARVRMIGYAPEPDIPALYAGAAAFMFPSLYEGFGLPILEAMACGTPVLTSNVSSCPEVANGHAVLVDPYSVDDIARGIEQAVAMGPAQREAARRYAAGKTWEHTARETLKVYELAAASRR